MAAAEAHDRPDAVAPKELCAQVDRRLHTDTIEHQAGAAGAGDLPNLPGGGVGVAVVDDVVRTERFRLLMMGSAFNLTNSTHFNDPSGAVTGSLGQITSSFGERQIRLGARLEF